MDTIEDDYHSSCARYLMGVCTRVAKGAVCKTVASASQVRVLSLPHKRSGAMRASFLAAYGPRAAVAQ